MSRSPSVARRGIPSSRSTFLPRSIAAALTAALAVSLAGSASAQALQPGDIVLTDGNNARVLHVHAVTGVRTVISSNSVGVGFPLSNPYGIAMDADGYLIVKDSPNVIRIDPATGDRTLMSGNSLGIGPALTSTEDIQVEPSGDYIVNRWPSAELFRVDPATGDRTVMSSSSVGTGFAHEPHGVGLDPNGIIYTPSLTAVVRVDPTNGNRSIASFGGGPALCCVHGITVPTTDDIYVTDTVAGGAVFHVDVGTGNRTLVSSPSQGVGPLFSNPTAIAAEADGNLLVGNIGFLLRIDPVTGDRTLLSNSTTSNNFNPRAILVVPAMLTCAIDQSVDASVRAVQNHSRALALMPDGRYWAVLRDGSDLELHHSDECDLCDWTYAASTPTPNDGARASIAIDPDCCTLHVLWDANVSGVQQVMHQEFDTCIGAWIGTPCVISPPTINCFADDIELTARGTVVAAYTETGWSVWLRQRSAACTWLPAQPLSTDGLGFRANLQAVGETIHSSFRTTTGSYGVRYRAYDTCSQTFLSATDIQVHAGTSNTSHIAADGCGNLYIMYSTSIGGGGQICVQYAPASGTGAVWAPTATWCTGDSALTIGNVNYANYSLATGAGNKVYAVYSLAMDGFTDAYYQTFELGVAGTGGTMLGGQPANTFRTWAGFRATQSTSGIVAVVENSNPPGPSQYRVDYREYAVPADPIYKRRTTKYGTSCTCSPQCEVPVLDCSLLPTASVATFGLTLKHAPPGSVVLLIVGDTKTAVDLGTLGAPGCFLLTNPASLLVGFADATGTAQFSAVVPPLPDCSRFYFQYAILQLGCNALALTTTNAIAMVFE